MDVGAIIGIIATILGCFVGLAGFLSGRDKKISTDSEWRGGVNAKLDSIDSNIKGACVDLKTVQATLIDHAERISEIDASTKSAHHRIDELIKK